MNTHLCIVVTIIELTKNQVIEKIFKKKSGKAIVTNKCLYIILVTNQNYF